MIMMIIRIRIINERKWRIIIRVIIVITIIINIMRMARMIVTYSNNNMLVITALVRKNKSDKNFKEKEG